MTGYTFTGWTVVTSPSWGTGSSQDGDKDFKIATGTYGDISIKANWTPNTDTAYTVNHHTKDLGANTYTIHSTDNLTGTTGATLTLEDLAKTITGFT